MEETIEKRGHEIDAIYQLSQLVNAGMDRKIVAVVMELIEYGVNPESIADGKFLVCCVLFLIQTVRKLITFTPL